MHIMSGLLRNVINAIWHAFDALHQEEPGLVNKTKLKVLTANIATILDLYGVEKGLDHFRSTSTLNFEYFRNYLSQEVFSTLPNSLTMPQLRNYEEQIEEICWLICRTKYLTLTDTSILEDHHKYKLFRIYCLLSDLKVPSDEDNNSDSCVVTISSSETILILQQVIDALGLDSETDQRISNMNQNEIHFRFDQFLNLLDLKYSQNSLEYEESLHEVIEEMYQTYIKDVIKKGYLQRRGYLLPTFKEYWFVLQPCELSYYKNHCEKELCGTINLDPKCMVKPSTASSSGKQEKLLKFILSAVERNFELAAHDHRTRIQWVTALQLAITYSTGREGFQRDLASRRRKKRDAELKRRRDEENHRTIVQKEVEKTKTLLEVEKQARLAAESQAREFEAVAKEDSRRVAELEDMKYNLEKLLEEETQAKRDEEIVRALQARVLAEEWEKREELEELQKEQKTLLELEREKRKEFETRQQLKEKELKDAKDKLKFLEEERKKLDMELKQARFKIIRSEENKEDLEARIDSLCPLMGTGGIRRTVSFVTPSRERPTTLLDLRESSTRKKAKQV